MIMGVATDDQSEAVPGVPVGWLPPRDEASPGGSAVLSVLRRASAAALVLLGTLMFLVAFLMPRESGEGPGPGYLIPWYVLPVIGTAAAVRLWPDGRRGAGPSLLVAIISLSGWCALLLL